MLFKKNVATRADTQAWQVLRWWRNAQEHTAWDEVDIRRPFERNFDQVRSILIDFDDESSVISSSSELKSVIEVLWERANEFLVKQYTQAPTELRLKSTPLASSRYLVKPFLLIRHSPLPFLPPILQPMQFFLKLAFLAPEEALAEIDEKRQLWADQVQPDKIDEFVFRQSIKIWSSLIQEVYEQGDAVPYSELIQQIQDQVLQADSQISAEYLKRVWQIPHFIFANQPDQAAFSRLLLQKSFQRQLHRISGEFLKMYLARALESQLQRKFDQKEQDLLASLLQKGDRIDEFIHKQLFAFYKELLRRCGVPLEFSELYGSEHYISRVLEVFARFPKPGESLSALTQHALYTLLLEETIRFNMRHSGQIIAAPEKVLETIIGIIVRRIAEFQRLSRQAKGTTSGSTNLDL